MLATGSAAALAGLSDRTLAGLISALALLDTVGNQPEANSVPLVEALARKLDDTNDALVRKQLAKNWGQAFRGAIDLSRAGQSLRNIFSQRDASPLPEVQSFFQLELQYTIDQEAAIDMADNFSSLVVLCFGGSGTAWSPLIKTYTFAGIPPIVASALVSSPADCSGKSRNICSFEFFFLSSTATR